MSWRRRNSHSRTHTHTLASAWSHTIRAMTRTGQDHSQEAYLWEIARLHITVSWNVTVTSTGWPHVKIIKSDDGGTLVPGTDGPISKSLSTNEHTYSSRLREMQPCVQVHRHTHTDTHRHKHTQSLLLISLFFFLPSNKATNPPLSTHALYSNSAITCKQSTVLRWAKHGADIQWGLAGVNLYVRHAADHYTQLIYDIQNPALFKTSWVTHVSAINIKVNQNQLVSHILFFRAKQFWHGFSYYIRIMFCIECSRTKL